MGTGLGLGGLSGGLFFSDVLGLVGGLGADGGAGGGKDGFTTTGLVETLAVGLLAGQEGAVLKLPLST